MTLTKAQKSKYSKLVILIGIFLLFAQNSLLSVAGYGTTEDAIEQIPPDTFYGQFVRFINENWIISVIIGVILILILINVSLYFR